jgi:hypothetical protein
MQYLIFYLTSYIIYSLYTHPENRVTSLEAMPEKFIQSAVGTTFHFKEEK